MKNLLRQRALITTICLSPLLVQCIATSQDFHNLDLRLRTMNNKLISMERNVGDLQTETAARANKSSVDDLQKNQADSINTLDYLKTQLLQIKGQIEENSHQVQKLQEDEKFQHDGQSDRFHDLNGGIESLRETLEGVQNRLTALEKKTQTDSATLQQMSGDIDKIREARAGEAAERARKAADEAVRVAKAAEEARAAKATENAGIDEETGATKPKTEGSPIVEPSSNKKTNPEADGKTAAGSSGPNDKKTPISDGKKTPVEAKGSSEKLPQHATEKEANTADASQKLYDEGLANFNAKKFQKAHGNFNLYLDKYPKGALAANARFWLGDSLYNQQKYELAILEYQKVIADYPQNGKSPAALLKQGMAFEQLKDNETAKLVYQKLNADYKNSEEATVAKKRLEALK